MDEGTGNVVRREMGDQATPLTCAYCGKPCWPAVARIDWPALGVAAEAYPSGETRGGIPIIGGPSGPAGCLDVSVVLRCAAGHQTGVRYAAIGPGGGPEMVVGTVMDATAYHALKATPPAAGDAPSAAPPPGEPPPQGPPPPHMPPPWAGDAGR